MGAIGVGTGVGAAACCALGSVAGLASVFMGILPFPNSLAGCPVLLAGTGAGWLMGGQSTDAVFIDVGSPAAPVAAAPAAPPAPPAPPAPTVY